MMLDYLPWVVAGMALVLAIVAVLVASRAAALARRILDHREATGRREASPRGPASPVPALPAAPPQSSDGRGPTTQQVVDWAREGFTSYGRRIQELEGELDLVMRELAKNGRDSGSAQVETARAGTAEPETGRRSDWGARPSIAGRPVGASGQPVEIRDGLIVPSRSLAATGSLVPGSGAAPALLYLNDSVEIDHLSQNRWAQFFDFGNGEPYRRYRTVEPSKVEWNPTTEQGRLIEPGRVEAV
ncbi:MAG TPA: hypothetical protein VMN39_06405 [Longimicrobiaceae bacterium]|nr:hypothetical protein [Longimicrobiaceae bacterium]